VRNTVLATAVAAVLTLSAADASAQSKGAASRAEIEAIQTQMNALIERVNRLEATNTQLQTENTELKATVERRDAETDYLKEQTKDLRAQAANATNELSKVKGTDWAKNVKVKGDFRYRHEMFDREDKDEDRHRERIRARIGVEAKVTDTILVGMQLATGGEDPRSSNQTLGSADTRKTIGLDLVIGVKDLATSVTRDFEYGMFRKPNPATSCVGVAELWCDDLLWCTPTLR